MFDNKNVLVTGAAGLSGHEAVKQLLDRGSYVRATVFNNPNYSHRKLQINHKKLEVVPCDLMDYDQCKKAVKDIDMVVNCLAFIRGAKGQTENPLQLNRNNLIPYVNLIEASAMAKVDRFGFIGSSTMYPDVDHPVTEDEAFTADPSPCYAGFGWMKRYCEKMCTHYHAHMTTKFALVRTGSIYGPFDTFDPEKSHVIPALILKANHKNDPFEIWGDGKQRRDFVYVGDLIEGLLLVMERHAKADPINIATGHSYSVNELVQTILTRYKYDPEIKYLSDEPSMIPARLISVEKAKNVLNWESKISLEEGIDKTVTWYLEESRNV